MVEKSTLFILLTCLMVFSCGGHRQSIINKSDASYQIPVYRPKIHHAFPHDPNAFTQGLFYADGFLYESTGLNGKSSLRKVDLKTGKVIRKINLAENYFGEGLTLWKDKIILLTWQNKKGFVYDQDTFQLVSEFSYPTEGWGITLDGEYLIMSDGTETLYFLNPDDYSLIKKIKVSATGQAVKKLNELEYVNGKIYANIWEENKIAVIDPDGTVVGWIDLEGLISEKDCSQKIGVPNGIAYNAAEDSLYVTGKNWCKVFVLEGIPSVNTNGIPSKRNY
jgi:glutaminyl-peptide cyclotransferase